MIFERFIDKAQVDTCIKVYEYLREKADGNKKQFTSKDRRCVEGFIELLEKKKIIFSEAFVKDYLLFQFGFWQGKKNRFNSKTPLIQWCFGNSAFNRWSSKKKSWRYFAVNNFKNPKKVDFDEISDVPKSELYNYLDNDQFEEQDRKQFLNTKFGFYHCVNYTSLYNPNSKYCSYCKYKDKCKATLLNKYPKLYRKRCVDGKAN